MSRARLSHGVDGASDAPHIPLLASPAWQRGLLRGGLRRHHDVTALARQRHSAGLADAPRGARDDRHPAPQVRRLHLGAQGTRHDFPTA